MRIFIKERIADLPVTNKRPLSLSVPKPLFARSHSHTAFGFQAMAIPDTGRPQETMSDDVDNSMDKGADIANEGKAINGGMQVIYGSSLSMHSHFLPEPEDSIQPTIQGVSTGLSLSNFTY